MLRYLVGYEVGRAVSRELVAGQLRGGAAQGIGGGLLEEFGYDEAGQPLATTFMDYRMPTAAEVPPIDVLLMSLMRLMWASLYGGPKVQRTHAESARQHDAILDALAAGDADAAGARTYQHIMDARHIAGGPSPRASTAGREERQGRAGDRDI